MINSGVALLTIFIVFFVGMNVFDATINSAAGQEYDEQKWDIMEGYWCAKHDMQRQTYVVEKCALFGCHTVVQSKCTDGKNDMLIDYDDEVFCEMKVKGDFGLC